MSTSSLATKRFEVGGRTYVASRSEKTNIVIHSSFSRTKYTSTAAQPNETCLMTNWAILADKVAGHYVIGRSGEITSCVAEDYWSNHLGPHKKFNNLNKHSLAIYLCNEMFLEKENSKYYSFGYVHPHNMYKGKVFERDFKGYKYWADYEEAQVSSLSSLLLDLCERHNIKKALPNNSTDFKPYIEENAGVFFPCNVNRESRNMPLPQWVSNKLEAQGFKLVR